MANRAQQIQEMLPADVVSTMRLPQDLPMSPPLDELLAVARQSTSP
ncbi:hypothetical protein [Nocardioides sp. SYSU DS0663]